MKKTVKLIKKSMAMLMLFAFAFGSFGISFTKVAHAAALPNWNASGSYVVDMLYNNTSNPHDMVLVQDNLGNLTGHGGSPAGANTYTWAITSGSVSGNSISVTANYTATPDAVTPQTVLNLTGTIALNGTISGTWSDNYQAGDRTGTFTTTSGNALALGTLAAQDFGVMDVSGVKGYTAGFGLTDATLAGATSVVSQLYSGTTLLQTDTAIIPKFNTDITGAQFSSPFDVFGTFDYVTDGYWTNVRGVEYGQTLIPTSVVATVTLANGKIVTATNTNLTGDPTTIFPPISVNVNTNPATTITSTEATLNGTNGSSAATGHSFWVSTSPFVTTSPTLPSGVYTTADLGAIAAGATFSASLSSSGLPSITPNTLYYFAAWSNVGGTWYPGAVLSFTTAQSGTEGTIGGTVTSGPGVLHVDSITSSENNANGIADGTYAHGWSYTFHITAPTNEPNLSMKFANWLSGANILPVANSMRISSLQASNGPIILTAANVYSSPALVMTGDLSPSTAGRQVDVTVELAIPVGTVNGSYTTSYGVQTN